MVGCSPPKDSFNDPIDAINETQKSLELPDLPLEVVENTGMDSFSQW